MSNRTTSADLERLAKVASQYFPAGLEVEIGTAYGQPRAVLRQGHSEIRELSPRDTKGAVAEWLRAFISGAQMARQYSLYPQDQDDRDIEAQVLRYAEVDRPLVKGLWAKWLRAIFRLEARGELRLEQAGPDARLFGKVTD